MLKLGLKGRGAATWLSNQGVNVLSETYDAVRLPDQSWVDRYSREDFLLASDSYGGVIDNLRLSLREEPSNVFMSPREDAEFLIRGSAAAALFAQTCAMPFRELRLQRLVCTRIAGVSCAILPFLSKDEQCHLAWIDASFAEYLWETLKLGESPE